jgi:murein DD-endopeptidase MepM/ murein hydrolase activator NlpD
MTLKNFGIITCRILVSLALIPVPCSPAVETDRSRFEAVAHTLAACVNEAQYLKIHSLFSDEMQQAYPPEKTEAFFGEMVISLGLVQETRLVTYRPPDEAVFSFLFERGAKDFYILLDAENRIRGLRVYPHSNIDLPADKSHETILYPPFRGRWQVLWGGESPEENIHHDKASQAHAAEFVGLGAKGKRRFKGRGKKNTDYYAFGREILAPAGGVVTDVIDGVRDNTPGSSNPYASLGNAVFIRHREKEISVLAYLQQGSILVKPGDRVTAGQVIARCGSSGAASEPALHYHLQDAEVIQDAGGIRCVFEKVFREKQGEIFLESDYTPVKGDILDM